MGSISDIESALNSVEDRVSRQEEYLERSRNEILEAMDKAQSEFGRDQNGQNAIIAMSQALNALSNVDSILYVLRSDIKECISNIRK